MNGNYRVTNFSGMCGRIYPPSEWSRTGRAAFWHGERPVLGNVPSPWKTRDRGVPKAMPVLGVVWEMTSKVPSRYRESPDVSALAQAIK